MGFIIIQRISAADTYNYEPLLKEEIFIYVIENEVTKKRYLFIHDKDLALRSIIEEYKLQFVDIDLMEWVYVKKTKQGLKISNKAAKSYKTKFHALSLNFKKYVLDNIDEIKEKQGVFYSKYVYDPKKVAVFNYDWLKNIMKSNLQNKSPKSILRTILNGAIIDEALLMILKTEFYYFTKNYMYLLPHSIILTNGGVGKSSILGSLGSILSNVSDAGLYGWYDTKRSLYNSGLVDNTNSPIIIDEINELIKKKNKILETLNTPLEQGIYINGKAGSKIINVRNQFLLLGNINESFNFEDFVFNLSNNPGTSGRRFGFIVYNKNLEFINGNIRNLTDKNKLDIDKFRHIISEYFNEIVIKKFKMLKFMNKLNKQSKLNEILKPYYSRIDQIAYEISDKGMENSALFLKEFKKSLSSRTFFMAMEITFFDNYKALINNEMERRVFIEKTYATYKKLLDILILQLDNINLYQNETITKHSKLEDLYEIPIYHKIFLFYIDKRSNELLSNKYIFFERYKDILNESDLEMKCKRIKDKIINKNQVDTYNNTLKNIGLGLQNLNKNIKIFITNIHNFRKFLEWNGKQKLFHDFVKDDKDTDIEWEEADL